MSDTSVQPVGESSPALTQIQRVVDTFSAPSKTFTDIARGHKSWWVPFLIYIILGYAFYGAVNSKIGMRQVSENQVKLSPKTEERLAALTPEQREAQMKITVAFTQGVFLATPVVLLIMGVVLAAVLLGTINFVFGGKAKFTSLFTVWMYAMLPSMIKTVLGIIVIYAGSAPESFNIKNYAPTNLGAFLNPGETNAALYSLATSLDAVTIWTLVLVAIGTSIVAGTKRSSGYIAVFGWWAIIVLLGVGTAVVTG
jgi:hypothetical protein